MRCSSNIRHSCRISTHFVLKGGGVHGHCMGECNRPISVYLLHDMSSIEIIELPLLHVESEPFVDRTLQQSYIIFLTLL